MQLDALKELYDEHWGRGDWAVRPAFYADGFEWGWSPEFDAAGVAGVYADTESPNSRLRTWLRPWERWECAAVEYIVDGENVVVLCRYRGRGKGSGALVDVDGAHVWRIVDGRAKRLEVFADRDAALASVGLGPQQ
jgi:ketosteroid isomerase-like protein